MRRRRPRRDRALVERCQAGDSAAFGNLYARYYERLLRFCLRRLNDRHEAEDAAQEAFARAWKALPRFAGERRFYPWLTVIAGNICTDMLRRRSRSTPTDDLELTAHNPLGAAGDDTSEELVLAAVDGELVNRALDRLSTRHRHVLAMREGSGWTYQQIADHEGVEIGTIETLLWRARQALKREFAAVSESKGALAGFLVATGQPLPPGPLPCRPPRRSMQQQAGGTTGGMDLRNARGRRRRDRCRGGGRVHCAACAQGQRHQRGRRSPGASALGRTTPRPGAWLGDRIGRSGRSGDRAGRRWWRRLRRWFASARRRGLGSIRRPRRERRRRRHAGGCHRRSRWSTLGGGLTGGNGGVSPAARSARA